MPRIRSVSLSLLLALSILSNAAQIPPAFSASGMVRELLLDDTRELYVDKITSSEIADTEEQKINVNLICKNLLKEPSWCVDIFFFSLVDTSGNDYQAKLAESRIMAARVPARDIVQGSLTFVIPKLENATQLVYNEPGSDFLVDLSSTKDPADKPPVSEWRLTRNKGTTLSDSRIELKIYDETVAKDRYVLDISILNKGKGVVDYNALYAYLKSASGFIFPVDLYADVEAKIDSGTLQPGSRIRGKIAFDVGKESGLFMLIYDDITGSYFATGKFVPFVSSEVTGKIIDNTDDLIKISKHNAYADPFSGGYKILGEVSNDSGNFVTDIQIHVVLKDSSGAVLSELDHILRNFLSSEPTKLASDSKLPFFVNFHISKTSIANIRSYELSSRYSLTDEKSAALLISDAELVQASKPTPLSEYVLWQINGRLMNNGDVRSTHTHIMASLYDSEGSVIGVGGFSILDKQPRASNPKRVEPFSIEIALPLSFKPSSFDLYAESKQFVIEGWKVIEPIEEEKEKELESPESMPAQIQNQTLVNIRSKQREGLLGLVINNLTNSTGSIYGIQISINETSVDTLKTKLRWDSKQIDNELLLFTENNPIKAEQTGRFLFSVKHAVDLVYWKAFDLNSEVLLEGEVKPFQIRFGLSGV
ncbi:MAG: DUF4352 domain-containing protein [Nitrososphaerales archaeon]